MRFLLSMMLVLSAFGQVFGSEKNDEVVIFKAHVGTLTYNPLRYCDSTYVDFLRKDYGIQCAYNEPFLWVNHSPVLEEQRALRKELVERITYVPLRYFMEDDKDPKDSVRFKQQNSTLLSCVKLSTDNRFQIQLDSNFEDGNPQDLLNQFKEKPECALGNCFKENGMMLAYVDTTKVEEELCKAGLICKKELHEPGTRKGHLQKYGQGINGYFGEEVKEQIKQDYKTTRTALFYARIRKLLGVSIVAIIAYIAYQKLYAAA